MMPKVHFAHREDKKRGVFMARIVECGVYPQDRLATRDRAKVTCTICLGTEARRGRKPSATKKARLQDLELALRVIYQAVRGDEKGEYWTLRKYLDTRDVFHGDLSDGDRLVEAVCRVALGL